MGLQYKWVLVGSFVDITVETVLQALFTDVIRCEYWVKGTVGFSHNAEIHSLNTQPSPQICSIRTHKESAQLDLCASFQ